MLPITREQRLAVKRVYDRGPITSRLNEDTGREHRCEPLTYRQFRATVYPAVRLNDTAMVWWKGMWLGIEPDGYTHS